MAEKMNINGNSEKFDSRPMNFALIRARESLGLTISEVSSKLGIPYATYYSYEYGNRFPPEAAQSIVLTFYNEHGVILPKEIVFPMAHKKRQGRRNNPPQPIPLTYRPQLAESSLVEKSTPSDLIARQEPPQWLENCLPRFINIHRNLLRMKYGFGCQERNNSEIARELGKNVGYVRSTHHSILKRLQKMLSESQGN